MGKRLDIEQSASIALLYTYAASNGTRLMLSYDRIKEFDLLVDINLDEMNSPMEYRFWNNDLKKIYFYSKDECGKEFLILKPDVDIKKAQSEFIDYLPLVVIIASQKENALKKLSIELQNGQFVERINTCNKVKMLKF